MNILKKFDVLKTRYTKWLEPKLKQKVIGKNTTAESCSGSQWHVVLSLMIFYIHIIVTQALKSYARLLSHFKRMTIT